ncbi:MAG TPA: hypothetical protein VLG25_03475 [Patescibacteria group bacterium]|nr:hypothetical protein [Patescibacteria group bacterium]
MNRGNYIQQVSSPLQQVQRHEVVEELSKAVSHSHEVLATATTVFPLTIFPDSVTIDREKLTITRRTFFRVAESMSIRIADILNVTTDVGPFFGALKISTRFFDPHKPYAVKYLWRDDAIKLKGILQGYIIALQKEIDCSALSTGQLTAMLEDLGTGALREEI